MPTVTVVLHSVTSEGGLITKRYKNAHVHINPNTNLLQVYRSDGQSGEHREILAEFHADTYLYWE